MAYPDIATKEDLAKELEVYAEVAVELEGLMRYTDSVLTAVHGGGLFDQLPPDEEARERHNAGTVLLSELQRRFREWQRTEDERPGTDLSIALMVMAKDAAEGRFSRRRVLEEDVPSLHATH
jgi:hypothetical protein